MSRESRKVQLDPAVGTGVVVWVLLHCCTHTHTKYSITAVIYCCINHSNICAMLLCPWSLMVVDIGLDNDALWHTVKYCTLIVGHRMRYFSVKLVKICEHLVQIHYLKVK